MTNLIAFLDKIERLLLDSPKLPLVNRVLVNEDALFELLDTLRQQLPAELEQAKQIVAHKSAIMAEAQRRAEQVVAGAEKKARQMVQDSDVMRLAQDEANELRRKTHDDILTQQEGADRYAEEVLSGLEQKVSRALTMVQSGRAQLAKG